MRLKQGWNDSPNGNKRLWDDTCGVGFSHIQLINISISGNTQLLELGKNMIFGIILTIHVQHESCIWGGV